MVGVRKNVGPFRRRLKLFVKSDRNGGRVGSEQRMKFEASKANTYPAFKDLGDVMATF